MKKTTYPLLSKETIAAIKADNKSEALYKAIKAEGDDVDGVIAAVQDGADVNRRYKDRMSEKPRNRLPLEWAIHFDKFERFKRLVGKKANFKATVLISPPEYFKPAAFICQPNVQMSLLHYAATKGNHRFVKYMVNDLKMDTTLQDSCGFLPIHRAIAGLNRDTVKELNDKQQVMTAVSKQGDFCIHIAAMIGKKDMFEFLISLGANIRSKGSFQRTPLHWAVLCRQKVIVAFLATDKAHRDDTEDRGRNAYLLAVEIDELELVTMLVLKDDSFAVRDGNGMSAMHIAAEKNNVPMLQFLHGKEGLSFDNTDNQGRTPLQIAIENDFIETFDFIINKLRKQHLKTYSKKQETKKLKKTTEEEPLKALLDWHDNSGRAILECALRNKASKILERLSELGIHFNPRNNLGNTMMFEAINAGDDKMIVWINRFGVPLKIQNDKGLRPEHIAAAQGKIPVLKLFQIISSVDFKAKDEDGMMPIHHASLAGEQETLEWLLQNNGGSVNDTDDQGRNCLFHAARGNRSSLIIHLVNVNKMSLKSVCSKKMTLMHHAVFKSAKNAIETLRQFGMSLEIKGDQGMTSLLLACQSNLPEMVDFLIGLGAKKEAVNTSGRNAWFYAASNCRDETLFKCLEKHSIPLTGVLDQYELSPVHMAAMGGNLFGLKYLISKGLGCFQKSKSGETPLQKSIKTRGKLEQDLQEKKNRPEYQQENNRKLREECEKIEARILGCKEVEDYLLSLNQELAREEELPVEKNEPNSKRERQDEDAGDADRRAIKPKVEPVLEGAPLNIEGQNDHHGPKM